jgi:hypothetical protein
MSRRAHKHYGADAVVVTEGVAMKRPIRMLALVIATLLIGWAAGRAQSSLPDFELIVNAPGGKTTIECLRGCDLKWWERGPNANSVAGAKFTYECGASECSSGRIGGWLRR